MSSLMLLGAGGPAGGTTLIFTGTSDPSLSSWTTDGTANLTQVGNDVYVDVPANLLSLQLPNSITGGFGGTFDFSNAGFSNLTTIVISASGHASASPPFSGTYAITSLNISGCTSINDCEAEYCALTNQSDIDGIIAACLASAENGNNNGTLLLDGGTNSTPSSTGLTNAGMLQSTYSWNVNTN